MSESAMTDEGVGSPTRRSDHLFGSLSRNCLMKLMATTPAATAATAPSHHASVAESMRPAPRRASIPLWTA
jgi:hypothetical protein